MIGGRGGFNWDRAVLEILDEGVTFGDGGACGGEVVGQGGELGLLVLDRGDGGKSFDGG